MPRQTTNLPQPSQATREALRAAVDDGAIDDAAVGSSDDEEVPLPRARPAWCREGTRTRRRSLSAPARLGGCRRGEGGGGDGEAVSPEHGDADADDEERGRRRHSWAGS